MFTNYSQTYASQILAIAGLIASFSAASGHTFTAPQVQFVLGVVVNLAGIVWAIVHRYNKGDLTALGSRI